MKMKNETPLEYEADKITYSRFEALISRFLDAHKNGEASRETTAGAITHIAAALDQGHRDEVRAWTDRPEVFDDWLKGEAA